tara:strand:- start:426 stop:1754 length:1329 start_codon:yes stop_codon:yes gene_type:complete
VVKANLDNFVDAFRREIDATATACVSCGKCYEICPITESAGVGGLESTLVTNGIRDILSGGDMNENSRKWADACILSGDCIDSCDYGINPRLMLTMARAVSKEQTNNEKERKLGGQKAFKALGAGVKVLSRMQLTAADQERLGQGGKMAVPDEKSVDYVFYTGCNVLKTPHIALLCLDIMDALQLNYSVLGGPSHCCGILQFRSGDVETSTKVASNTIEKFIQTGATEVLSWCPTCQVQYSEFGLPTYENATGIKPFEMRPFVLFLESQLDALRPLLKQPVKKKIALHLHPGIAGLPDAARRLCDAVPGVEVIDLNLPEMGLMSNSLSTVPSLKKDLQAQELAAAEAAGVDALAAVYHADHRELCAHERDYPFSVINFLEIIAESMGIFRDDTFKTMKIKQDADKILKDCANMLEANAISKDQARPIIETALLGEQPVPLRG